MSLEGSRGWWTLYYYTLGRYSLVFPSTDPRAFLPAKTWFPACDLCILFLELFFLNPHPLGEGGWKLHQSGAACSSLCIKGVSVIIGDFVLVSDQDEKW